MKKRILALIFYLTSTTAFAGTGSVEEQTLLLNEIQKATPQQQRIILHAASQMPIPGIEPIVRTIKYTTNGISGPYGMTDWVQPPREETRIAIVEPRQAYIIVNIPAFTLYAVEDDKVVFSSKIIVGKGSTELDKTPIMTTKITSIAWNPYWAPPYRYNRNETRSNWLKDKGYLKKNNLSIIRNVDHSILPENEINKDVFLSHEHTIVQTPGDDNMLGKALFYLDNPHSVYMHDTNNHTLFAQKNRNFSMGCIRVEEWRQLAAWVLQKQEKDIDEEIQTGKMLFNWLDQPMPVHVVYWGVDIVDRKVVYYNDIYNWVK